MTRARRSDVNGGDPQVGCMSDGVGPPACRGEQQDRREGGGADRSGPGKKGQFLSGEPLGQLSLGSPGSPEYGEARQDVRDGPVGPMRLRGGDSKANGNFDVGPVAGGWPE